MNSNVEEQYSGTATENALVEGRKAFLGFLAKRVGNRADAEDVFQEFCIRVLTRKDQLRDVERMDAWLYAILRSTMNDHFRKATRRSRLAVAVARDPHQLVADAPVQMARLCTCPSRLLTELRTVDAKLIRRIDFGEEDRKIVAADMGLNRNALGVRLHRARAALREAIQYHCGACCLEDPDDCYCPV
ncbi:RNA polymerase, sigma subunit, SigZ [Roseovarius mucosus DSM 17069]|jgi:RNA polymerase sigma-70 factor (ECF subfamily)|uniref:RNA polymerase sigma factor SigZ n=2 Tax=Roseovarius mucosus TaxID=215743 RepID=A0A1V0RUY1_9RHOB|nr:sigma-70 family RNA polymerase sigma factor [Roseovarius mucosus]ARE85607.1 RNA polymerase sigma factor SigZ [Roseovarius mucosus]KGM86124.1 RNA polymerase, sigma subunit, SigZ [Roseovarius mucosus DSM 17069]MAN98953.1 RNA polymerase subunit sigma-70 [Roseovarius sp.]PKQ11486.1 MAG: RNA polymerase subunit sigma-70 [Alphaproteobacteria bacterium HGW-Alphaproteobacteria-1]|tara:strand:+ start:2196 stop:2759 length:564 start_codon:yes stop_codon:yes gene_type:complete